MECSVVVVIVVETAPKPSRFFCSLLARCRIPCACHAKQHLNLQTWSEHVVFLTFWLGNVLRATTACTFSTSQLPKVVFLTFWLGNVLRATTACTFSTSSTSKNGFFDISTSKSGPRMMCFAHYGLEVCFAPQRRPRECFIHFWLGNVLRVATASTFSTSQLPKVVREWCVLYILTSNVLRATTACNFSSLIWPHGSAPAALASLLFDPPEPQIIGKT